METDLHKALERGEFVVLYQPQVDLLTGKIMGAEALIRWQHPERGIISPATFIPLAEETSLIMQIGEWVLHTACLQNKAWQDMGLAPMVVSVNLSPRQFLQSDIVNTVRRVLEETGLQPQYLELEITESMTMDVNRTISILQELKGLGVKISLDDFGSGYSSLSYLKKFPIDKLKIDQSFVRDSTTDLNVATIVKTIIEMAHSLNLHVIAEGVETKEHLSFLQYNLCDEVQGYLFSKPLPAKEFEKQFTEIEKIARMKGISQGASHNIRIEEELRIIRQDLQDTVRQQQGMIFKFTRQDGRFIHTLCDGELLYRMGLVPGQVVGKALTDFLPPDVAAVKTKYYETAWQGKENVSYEGSINGIVYIATLRPVIRGGFVTEVIGSCIDITERKQVEEALRKSEEKYRLIAENMNDLIGVLDINGVVLYASPSHQTVLGLSPSMLEGRMAFERVHPDDVQDIKKQFARMVSSKMPCQVEFRYIHCDGHEVYVEANGSPVIDEFGELTHIVVVSRDISEQKRTEEFLRKTEGLSTVGELAAGVAHEIRNPLTTIKGFVQLQQQGAFKPTYLDIMLNEVNRIETIINEFLILGNSQEVHIEKIDIGGLLQQVKELLAAQAILKNIQIHCDSKPKLPFIRGNESKLKQMFVNLLKNAIDSMNDGGDIRIEAGKQDYDSILIRIIDQGCGMDEERIKRLGEPCYSTKEKGTGVGLMVSYKIIKEHHGTIDFQSEINRGTTVTVKLPISGTDI
ncbi:hypothetical protein skT53_00010 [Effusibacillus dendaii]|uniref:histidine kinase n=1 Tax=Effusibacillus dendaii TaxID=2743772 RepID=A0A7I8D890_9BACL|nr:hypothetical protein skT53_00010 [Effusibacillus dendaii]